MKRFIGRLLLISSTALLAVSCQDDVISQIGESIQAPQDKVESHMHRLRFQAETVPSSGVIASGSTASLLGRIADPTFGDFSGEFISQVRTARGFRFAHQPIDDQIDSVRLVLTCPDFVGDDESMMKIGVYEVKESLAASSQSLSSLEHLRKPELLLGQGEGSIRSFARWHKVSSHDSVRLFTLTLDKTLGERIYRATKATPQYFDTQTSFEQHVLGGLLVTPLTGSGAVLRVVTTQLQIFYSYLDAEGKKVATRETFIDTKQTTHLNGLNNSFIDELLKPNDKYVYIKQPAGVVAGFSLGVDQLARLMQGRGQINIGTDWSLADAQFNLTVDNPEKMLLNPPTYMLLLPKDSVEAFFSKQQTERTRSATSYLSSEYSVQQRYYNFSNISKLITEHLRHHAKYQGGAWHIDSPLELRMLPVERQAEKVNNTTLVTTRIDEYLFPSFVRLDKTKGLEVEVISSLLKQ